MGHEFLDQKDIENSHLSKRTKTNNLFIMHILIVLAMRGSNEKMLIDSLRRFILYKEVTKDKYSDKEIKEIEEED